MKERPILFSSPMVRALLDGSKTQTRRTIKPQPKTRPGIGCTRLVMLDKKGRDLLDTWIGDPMRLETVFCPYGQPGDRLWVRETWRTSYLFDAAKPSDLPDHAPLRYEADNAHIGAWGGYGLSTRGKLRPSIFMPRWASRITLEVVNVRVEMLQGISEEDACAEGWIADENDPISWYAELWESINGKGSWDANPFVWVIEFKRIN